MSQRPENSEPLSWTILPPVQAGKYHAHTTTILSVTSEDLLFVAEGDGFGGIFEVSMNETPNVQEIIVDIQAEYRHEDAFDSVEVYLMRPAAGKEAIGISRYDDRRRSTSTSFRDHSIQFNVHVFLPHLTTPNTLLQVNTLRTNLPHFAHRVHDLKLMVHFERIAFKTQNSAVSVKSVSANLISLSTSNGAISGAYNVSRSLEIITSNGAAIVDALLENGNASEPTRMSVNNNNGFIQATIRLLSSREDRKGGYFDVTAITSNGPVTASFMEQPPHSCLNASIRTSNGPANVRLHPAFEGLFIARGFQWMLPNVSVIEAVQDPARMGRTRRVVRQNARYGTAQGDVHWVPAMPREGNTPDGRVEIVTSNAPLMLSL